MHGDDTVRAAIEASDYSQLSTDMQDKISEDRFAKMTERHATKAAVQTAIENGDYDAFVEVADERMLDRIEDQEDFDKMVTRHQTRTAHREAIETAVKNNDFAAFDAAMEAHKTAMEALDDGDDHPRHTERPTLTDEQKQEKFDKLVEYYTENGELPQRKHAMGRGHKRWHHHGDRDHKQWGKRFDRD